MYGWRLVGPPSRFSSTPQKGGRRKRRLAPFISRVAESGFGQTARSRRAMEGLLFDQTGRASAPGSLNALPKSLLDVLVGDAGSGRNPTEPGVSVSFFRHAARGFLSRHTAHSVVR